MATSPFDMPIFLNMMTDTVFTRTYGMPSAKYNVGTHAHGLIFFFIIYNILVCCGSQPSRFAGPSLCGRGSWIIMGEDLPVSMPLGSHDSGTYLAETHTMPPSGTAEQYH